MGRSRRWGVRMTAALAACSVGGSLYAQEPAFSGRVRLELVEEIGYDHQLRLLADFAYRDPQGREWLAPAGALLSGWTIPRELHGLPGLPMESEFRKSAVVHDHFAQARNARWRDVHRMLHDAAVTEGLAPTEAKLLFMTVYASGWRWEPQGSSCYGSCHASAAILAWRPDATMAELAPLVEWVQQADPPVEAIEARVDAALKRPGPHLFTQLRQ